MNKSSYGVDWLQNGILYGPAKLDDRLYQNVQDTRRRHKVYRENHEKLASGIDSQRKKFSWGKNPERYIPWVCIITITVYNSDDATQLHT